MTPRPTPPAVIPTDIPAIPITSDDAVVAKGVVPAAGGFDDDFQDSSERSRRPVPGWLISLFIMTGWIVGLGILWQLSADRKWVDPLFTSSPSAIWTAAKVMVQDPDFRNMVWVTIWELGISFAVAATVGVLFGLLAGWYSGIRRAIQPPVNALYATPRVALLPLFVLWLGIGHVSRIGFVVSVAALPIFINTIDGVRIVDKDMLRVAKVFRASRYKTFKQVVLPHAVPQIISGLKVGLIMSLLSVVIAQVFIGSAGIGYLLTLYGNTFQTDKLMVCVLFTAILGLLIMYPMNAVEKYFSRWRAS
jgi:ABC-type nitrate/sulfonate/bicarbonate transport system permease component